MHHIDYEFVLNRFAFPNGLVTVGICLEDDPGILAAHQLTAHNARALGRRTAAAIASFETAQWVWQQGEIGANDFPLGGLTDPLVRPQRRSTAGPRIANESGLDNLEQQALSQFVEQGFCKLPTRVDGHLLEQINRDLDAMVERSDVDHFADGDHRIEQVHTRSVAAREIWTLPAIMRFLRAVFQKEPLPCQTLVFLCGSGQDVHQDTIHLTPFPAGYMCGVWIALEDIKEDARPLLFTRAATGYRGSTQAWLVCNR